MRKVLKFTNMTFCIPIRNGESKEEVEDRLIDAIEEAGSRFITYTVEIEENDE